ncbi:hypothetical protein ACFQO9_11335 [Chryseobacterium zhengzhouense]|uniref:Major capsid protein n=1 Tax=Chryseobacterium zhengzhouense TaxID=1636086 RepID=A0ABW2M1N9_9FLAO
MSFKNAHQHIQRTILNYAKTDTVHNFLLAVLLAANRNNRITATDFGQEAGKLRTFKLNYLPPSCDDDTVDNSASICSPGVEVEPLQEYWSPKKVTKSKVIKIRMENMRDLDGININEFAAANFANELKTLRTKLAKQVGAVMISNAGTHLDGSPTKLANLVNQTTGVVNPIAKSSIEKTFLDAELNPPIVVGGDSVFYAQAMQRIGGLNDQGQNIAQVPFQNYFYDGLINQLYDSGENILAFDPSVFKFIAWNQNLGRFATDDRNIDPQKMFSSNEGTYLGTMVDPVTGLLWDLDAKFELCDTNGNKDPHWKFQFSLIWDIFFLPKQTCWKDSVNGIFHFKGCEVGEQTCPDVTPVTPIATKTFSFTPTSENYGFIGNVSLGGRDFKPEVNVANIDEFLVMLNGLSTWKFTKSGSSITYVGFSPLSGKINDTQNIAFTEA